MRLDAQVVDPYGIARPARASNSNVGSLGVFSIQPEISCVSLPLHTKLEIGIKAADEERASFALGTVLGVHPRVLLFEVYRDALAHRTSGIYSVCEGATVVGEEVAGSVFDWHDAHPIIKRPRSPIPMIVTGAAKDLGSSSRVLRFGSPVPRPTI